MVLSPARPRCPPSGATARSGSGSLACSAPREPGALARRRGRRRAPVVHRPRVGLAGDLDGGLTVCRGLGGTLLLLLSAHRSLGEAEHLGAARLIAHRALDRMGPDPAAWPSGVRGGGFSPGLMTGLAGSMYALTEVAEPTGAGLLAPILG